MADDTAALRRRARPSLLPRGKADFVRQVVIWLGFVFAYQVARGLADHGVGEALRNGRRLIHAEEALGGLWERDVQHAVLDTGGLLLHLVNWTYWLAQFAVVGLALIGLYLWRTRVYFGVRNALIVANTTGLFVYVGFPAAPPRMYPELGFVDTLARSEVLNHGTSFVEIFSNPYAAMPSLHFADAVIVAVGLALAVRHRLAKAAWLLWPFWVAFALIASANHFWIDLAAGLGLAALGGLAVRYTRLGRGSG